MNSDKVRDYFMQAFEVYRRQNNGGFPEQIVIYRDGVGDSMRRKVIDTELVGLRTAIEKCLKDGDVEPTITLVIVNKRVRQRFFFQSGQGHLSNPHCGTYVDYGFVEDQNDKEGVFDFFLMPHNVTQGSVKPTHFYVAENNSEILNKEVILNFTYALCFSYFNSADSIKIPAPCMLADRLAIYRHEIGNIPCDLDLHCLPYFL